MAIGSFRARLTAAAISLAGVLAGHYAGAQQPEANPAGTAAPANHALPTWSDSTKATAGQAEPGAGSKAESPGSAPAKKPDQGIKVHGRWVLDLKNPDGTLVSHREFENSLVTASGGGLAGDQVLTALLSGNAVSGGPGIAFLYGSATQPGDECGFGNPPQYFPCQLFTVAGTQLSQYTSQDVSNNVTGLNAVANFTGFSVSWVLSGNFTVPTGSPTGIYMVGSVISLCTAPNASFNLPLLWAGTSPDATGTVSPETCATINPAGAKTAVGALTFTAIPNAPLKVTPGQVISVSVTISFS